MGYREYIVAAAAAVLAGCIQYEPHPEPPADHHVQVAVDAVSAFYGEDFSDVNIAWAAGECMTEWPVSQCTWGFQKPGRIWVIYWGPGRPLAETELAHELTHEYLHRTECDGDGDHEHPLWDLLGDVNAWVRQAEVGAGYWPVAKGEP